MTASCSGRPLSALLSILFLLFALAAQPALGASSPVLLSGVTQSLRLVPHLDALADPAGTLGVEQIASTAYIQKFTPLAFRTVDASAGASWLRFTLEADKDGRLTRDMLYPVLDLGAEQPGPVQLFVPHYADDRAAWPTDWETLTAQGPALIPLPVPPSGTVTCYVRLAGPPGLWFNPTLTLRKATTPMSTAPSAADMLHGLMAGLILLNLLLMCMGRGESRFWLALYGLLALVHSLTSPAPAPAGGLPFAAAWSILTPGLALVLLPHVGRHILTTWSSAPAAESGLRWLSIMGALLAVLPLVPGCSGLVRLLPLWPLMALPTAIPAIHCCRARIPGSRRFLLAILCTALGTLPALLPASGPDMARLLSVIPFAGTALGLLLITPIVGFPRCAPDEADDTAPVNPDLHNEILSRVSHDLRTPLNAIAHGAEALFLTPLDAHGVETLRTIQAATGNLSTLINDLLDVSRASKGRLHLRNNPFDLQRVLIEAHDIILPMAEQKGLQLSWFMAPHLNVKFSGDADRLLQVLLNLLGNAVRFSDHGTVTLRVTRVPDSTTAGHLLFSIRDTGISIPLQNQYDVFEDFCHHPGTGKGRYGGTGLGLTVARELVGLMGGVMCLDSNPNQGTEVSFSVKLTPLPGNATASVLPLEDDLQAYTPFSKPPVPLASRIIVADDVASNRQLIRFFMEGLPYTLAEARTGEELVTLYGLQPAGAVLIDADMPGMGGPQAVRTIREFEALQGLDEAPILAMVSRPEERDVMLDAGCTAILLKPISRSRLMEMITTLAPRPDTAFASETAEGAGIPALQAIDTDGTSPEAEAYPPSETSATDTLPPSAAHPPATPQMAQLDAYPRSEPSAPKAAVSDNASLDISLVPLVPGLLTNLEEALQDAHRNVRAGSPLGVQEAASRLGGTAASFGLRDLERMARCVERAADADDLDAILNLLPELENMVRRNHRALDDIYRMHKAMTASKG